MEVSEKIDGANITVSLLSQLTGEYNTIINATPVGMYPNIDAMPVQSDVIDGCSAVFDLIYNPGETKLLKVAREMGKKAMGGMPMLVWQAAAAHKIWYGASLAAKISTRLSTIQMRIWTSISGTKTHGGFKLIDTKSMFKNRVLNEEKLLKFGFFQDGGGFYASRSIMHGQFKAEVYISDKAEVSVKVYEAENGQEYSPAVCGRRLQARL